MSLLPTPNLTISAPVLRARFASRGPAEINDSSGLDGASTDADGDRAATGRRREDRTLSHFGAKAAAPLWNGPRLNPAFVAQVLGQVMMDTQDRASARAPAGYRGAQIAPGVFLDRGT